MIFIIYENIHNANLEKITYMKYSKDIWKKLQVLYVHDNNKINGEKEVEK